MLAEHSYVDPAAGVDDEIGRADGPPHLGGQVLGTHGQVGVGQQEESGGHGTSQLPVRWVPSGHDP